MTQRDDDYTPGQVAEILASWQLPTRPVVEDGRACLVCGRSRGIMRPCGTTPDGRQVFRHPDCELPADEDEREVIEVLKHLGKDEGFLPQRATFTADTENGNTAFCLAIEDDSWLVRADDLFAAIGAALTHAGGGRSR